MEQNKNIIYKYINPLTDYGFKKVFGDEEIMREFLNDLLKPKPKIKHVIFLNKDIQPENDTLRGIIYDMRCLTEDGSEIIVEMQNRGQTFFTDRILYYLAHSIAPQGYQGRIAVERKDREPVMESWNFDLKPVYGIFFLNFPLENLTPMLVRTVKFMVEETTEVFNNKVRAYTIQLPCIKDMKEEDCKDVIEYWSYNLYNMETMNTQLAFTQQKPIFMRMASIADYSSMNTEQQRIYMDSLNNYRTVMAAKEYDFNRGMEKGAKSKATQNAMLMLADNMPVDLVAKYSGLSTEEVKVLAGNQRN